MLASSLRFLSILLVFMPVSAFANLTVIVNESKSGLACEFKEISAENENAGVVLEKVGKLFRSGPEFEIEKLIVASPGLFKHPVWLNFKGISFVEFLYNFSAGSEITMVYEEKYLLLFNRIKLRDESSCFKILKYDHEIKKRLNLSDQPTGAEVEGALLNFRIFLDKVWVVDKDGFLMVSGPSYYVKRTESLFVLFRKGFEVTPIAD